MATKQTPKGSVGGGEQKKAGAPPPEAKEKENQKEPKKEEKVVGKAGGKDLPKEAKDKKPAKEDKKGEPSQGERGRSGRQEEHSRGRERGRRASRDRPDHRGHDREEREVCRNFLHNRCDRGSLCKYYHPRSSSRSRFSQDDPDDRRSPMRAMGSGGQIICRDFIRNMCARGTECRFYHPPTETSGKKRQGSWLTFCHDFRNGHCLRSDCRFFHITREDEESYRASGEIPPHIVDQAVRKAMVLDGALTGTRPTCKEFLRGLCNMQNCRFRHLNQREYGDEVFHALQEEFENLLGPPDRRPGSPQMGNLYGSLGSFHDPAHATPPAEFREDLLPPEEMRGPLMPLAEYESEPKRPRYFSGDGMFSGEGYREAGDMPRKWDDRMEYDHDHPDFNPNDSYRMMQEIYNLRNDNMDIRRDAERKIAELKEEVARALEENVGLRHEITKIQTAAGEDALAHKTNLEKLTMTNNSLMETLHKAEDTARRLEHENREKIKAMDNKQKNNSVELERKIEALQKESAQLRDALGKASAAHKKTEDEKMKLLAELEDLRAKVRNQSSGPLRKDHQQHSNNSGYSSKSSFPRDSMGSKDRGESSYSDMMHQERRLPDNRDQDMRSLSMRGQDRYSTDTWGGGDENGRSQYNSQGYSIRGAPEAERSRPWQASGPSQDSWSSHSNPKSTSGSLMGEYQTAEERMRGPAHDHNLLRGPSYPPSNNTGSGLLTLPMEVTDYGNSSSRQPQSHQQHSHGGQMNIDTHYSNQNMMHFEERDYSLSGYDTDSRGQYSSQQRAVSSWQQAGGGASSAVAAAGGGGGGGGGGGNSSLVDGGRGRGGIGQTWNRRGKPF